MVEYFEAHSSSKVLTSDRTLQKLRKRRLNQVRFRVNRTTHRAFDLFGKDLSHQNCLTLLFSLSISADDVLGGNTDLCRG